MTYDFSQARRNPYVGGAVKFRVRVIQGSDVSNADVTIRMFAGPEEGRFQLAGTLHLLHHEWAAMRAMLEAGAAMDELSAFGHRVDLVIEEEP